MLRAVYELKTAAALTGEHQSQLLNYLMLLDLRSEKLLNFRGTSVEWRFVNNPLTLAGRRAVALNRARWENLTSSCTQLRETMAALLADWGAFLDVALYEEALVHLLGGDAKTIRRIALLRDGSPLGTQRVLLLNETVAFRLTAFTEDLPYAEAHLRRFLDHTALRGIQWINLAHGEAQFVTLIRG